MHYLAPQSILSGRKNVIFDGDNTVQRQLGPLPLTGWCPQDMPCTGCYPAPTSGHMTTRITSMVSKNYLWIRKICRRNIWLENVNFSSYESIILPPFCKEKLSVYYRRRSKIALLAMNDWYVFHGNYKSYHAYNTRNTAMLSSCTQPSHAMQSTGYMNNL